MEIDGRGRTVHFPRSCLHCEEPDCVTVCPTGASYKRAEDGIVLVNPDTCIGCKLCSWACPYGAREYDHDDGVMKKCTLCVDRIYNENLPEEDRETRLRQGLSHRRAGLRRSGRPRQRPVSRNVAERGGFDLLKEFGFKPVNKYLPPRDPADRRHRPGARSRGPDRRAARPAGASVRLDRRPAERLRQACIRPIPSSCSPPPRAAGYGLWIWLGLRTLLEGLPDRAAPGVTALVLGGVSGDPRASVLDLSISAIRKTGPGGAFSQWRSSWLSREGVAALATYLPAGALFSGLSSTRCAAGCGAFSRRCWCWEHWSRSGAPA